MIAEHSLVVLDADPPHDELTRGDVGTVVHVYSDGKGYEVEFVDGGGRTVALVSVGADDVRPIKPGELLHARATANHAIQRSGRVTVFNFSRPLNRTVRRMTFQSVTCSAMQFCQSPVHPR